MQVLFLNFKVMKNILLSLAMVLAFYAMQAQNANDALRYSLSSYNGTARFMGLSGAYGAIGADFSSLSQNPAGIGLYRKSEFTISPGFYNASTSSSFFGNKESDFRNNMTLGNMGMIFAANLNENKGEGMLKGLQFGFGMNRTNNFSNRVIIEGYNTTNSLMGHYADVANNDGNPMSLSQLDEFSTLMAYDVNLLVYDSGSQNNPAHYWVDMPNGNVLQRKSIQMSGSSREMLLSGGLNYNNKLYLGLSLCFPSLRYEETSNYSELDNNHLSSSSDPDFNFSSVQRTENLTTKGSGFNLKFGIIYKPVEFLRIGGAIHTSTTYNLTDDWSSKMTSTFENGDTYTSSSPDGAYDYKLSTPFKAIGSIAFVFPKFGFITADYEYIDYSSAKLRADDYDFFDENEVVKTNLNATGNLRIGAEYRHDIFAFRAGTSFYGSPYKNETTRGARMGYSAGIGIREKDYFLDFAFNHQLSKDDLYLYGATAAENTYKVNQLLMTLGFKF